MVKPLYRMVVDGKEGSVAEGSPVWGILAILVLSLGTAWYLGELARVMRLLGGTCGVIACYCLPGLLYLALPRSGVSTTKAYRAASVGVLIVGGFIVLSTFIKAD